MIAALARDFAPVCVLCLGDAELPAHENDGSVEIHRLPGMHAQVLQRATAFAQFVEFHAGRHAATLKLIVYRGPAEEVAALIELATPPYIVLSPWSKVEYYPATKHHHGRRLQLHGRSSDPPRPPHRRRIPSPLRRSACASGTLLSRTRRWHSASRRRYTLACFRISASVISTPNPGLSPGYKNPSANRGDIACIMSFPGSPTPKLSASEQWAVASMKCSP